MDDQYQTPYNHKQASGSTGNFQDTSKILSNNETDLNSTQQGYLKAINKLVRSIERAHQHTKLLTSSLEKKDA